MRRLCMAATLIFKEAVSEYMCTYILKPVIVGNL